MSAAKNKIFQLLVSNSSIFQNLTETPLNVYYRLRDEIWEKFEAYYLIFQSNIFLTEKILQIALNYTDYVFQMQNSISNRPEIELLLYISGQRQINEAIESVGVKFDGNSKIVHLISTKHNNLDEITSYLEKVLSSQNSEFLNTINYVEFNRLDNCLISIPLYLFSPNEILNQFLLLDGNALDTKPYSTDPTPNQLIAQIFSTHPQICIEILETLIISRMAALHLENTKDPKINKEQTLDYKLLAQLKENSE